MEQLSNLINQSPILQRQSSTTSLAVSKVVSERAVACRNTYGDFKSFCGVFNIVKTDQYISTCKDRMFSGNAPTLLTMKATYGENEVEGWICLFLADIIKFKGLNDKASVEVVRSVGKSILTNYNYLKATEVMLFFSMFKSCSFRTDRGDDATRMYGEFSGDVVMDCLNRFISYRATETDRIERAEKTEKNKDVLNQGISYEEYLKLKKQRGQ